MAYFNIFFFFFCYQNVTPRRSVSISHSTLHLWRWYGIQCIYAPIILYLYRLIPIFFFFLQSTYCSYLPTVLKVCRLLFFFMWRAPANSMKGALMLLICCGWLWWLYYNAFEALIFLIFDFLLYSFLRKGLMVMH